MADTTMVSTAARASAVPSASVAPSPGADGADVCEGAADVVLDDDDAGASCAVHPTSTVMTDMVTAAADVIPQRVLMRRP
ncbi:hypothetical protein FFA01_19910 [Frigoribacterium faeni]|uniref:Uncharacterized protein n=1 Tax=Frigoribacterium faeni TaxID=145483 RepID=A0ABQ0UQC4_9MICO|nr:hypothetical protein FFA01_19910 [Frigoribacterium faeni]